MSESQHPLQQAYADALSSGQPADIPVGDVVLCDIDSTDLTADPRSGGYLFGSYAVGPCCAASHEATVRGYGEESYINARCPEGMSFADWIRSVRGPHAAIRITPGWRPS
jgi:hypothetical protein